MRTELQENRDVENNRRSEKRWTEHQDDRTKVDRTTGRKNKDGQKKQEKEHIGENNRRT